MQDNGYENEEQVERGCRLGMWKVTESCVSGPLGIAICEKRESELTLLSFLLSNNFPNGFFSVDFDYMSR